MIFNKYKSNIKLLILVVIFALVLVGVRISTSYVYKQLIDFLVVADYREAGKGLIIVSILFFLAANIRFVCSWLSVKLESNIMYKLKEKITKKITEISPRNYKTKSTSSYETLLINNIRYISDFYRNTLGIIYFPLLFIGAIIMGIYIDITLLLVTLLIITIALLVNKLLHKNTSELYTNHTNNLAKNHHFISDALSGHEEVKTNQSESFIIEKANTNINRLAKSAHRLIEREVNTKTTQTAVKFLTSILIVICGAYQVYNLNISVGEYVAFLSITSYFFIPLERALGYILMFKTAKGGMLEIERLLSQETRTLKVIEPKSKVTNIIIEKISLMNEEKNIVKNASLIIEQGEKVVISGNSGSGKTTFMRFLKTELKKEAGKFSIMGETINDNELYDTTKILSAAQQNVFVFNISILENIRLYNSEISMSDVIEAASKSEIHNYITTLEKGYETIISEKDRELSGGQKQRICLARALCRKTPILLLDEPTSMVNKELRNKIFQNVMTDNFQTVFYITHHTDLYQYATSRIEISNQNLIYNRRVKHV